MKRICLIAAAAIAGTAHATEPLEPIVIAASRTPITADEALASVTVIDRAEIDSSPATDLPDLLTGRAGVDISRNGGRGQNTSVHLRGTNRDHVLVLVDGVRVGSATAGGAALQSLPLEQIERIEVVRGPRSTLYGADAIGGVIQVFTRADATHLEVGAGSQRTASISGGYGFRGERYRAGVTVSGFRTDGFDVTDEDNFAADPDRDGYRQRSVGFRGEYDVSDAFSVDGGLLRSEDTVEFDGTPDETDGVQQVARVGADWRLAPHWRVRLSGARSVDDQDSRDASGGRYATKRSEAGLQSDVDLGRNDTLTLGLDYRRDRIEVDDADFAGTPIRYDETRRDNQAAFAQYQWYGERWDVQLGLRHDDNEAYGEVTTGNAALGYRVDAHTRVFASHGSAFKAPTFNDLYYPDVGFFRGNPDLRPERSRTSEIGVSGGDAWRWGVNAYYTVVDDLIVFDGETSRSENVDRARIRGLETTLGTTVANTDVDVGLTWLDAEDADTGNELPRRASRSLRLALARDFGPVRGGLVARHLNSRFDDRANTTELGSHTLLDLSAAWRLNRDWTLRAELTNALDESYQTAATYDAPGRAVFASIAWRPGSAR